MHVLDDVADRVRVVIALRPVSARREGRRAVPVVIAARAVRARGSWAGDARAAHRSGLARQTPVRRCGSVVRARDAARAEGRRRDRDHGPLAALGVGAFRDEGALHKSVHGRHVAVHRWQAVGRISSRDRGAGASQPNTEQETRRE